MSSGRCLHGRTPFAASHARPVLRATSTPSLLMVHAKGPPIMVNSCTGKMGHATAEAVVKAGLELVPFTFCGISKGVAVGDVGISGIPVERVSPEKRAEVRVLPRAARTRAPGAHRPCRPTRPGHQAPAYVLHACIVAIRSGTQAKCRHRHGGETGSAGPSGSGAPGDDVSSGRMFHCTYSPHRFSTEA